MKRKRTGVVSVKKIKEIIRLRSLGHSQREIARSVNLGRTTVQEYLQRLDGAGVDLKEALSLSEEELLERVGKRAGGWAGAQHELPYEQIQRELARPHVTLRLLWEEYITQTPNGYGYSTYCALYARWRKKHKLSMRMPHKAGEKTFVDYAGARPHLTDPETGEQFPVELFVAVLGASNLTYAEAQLSQELPHWIGGHVRAFEYFGGVSRAVVPDNLKSGVTKASFYDPDLNPTYAHFAEHYGTAVLPTRVRKPRDKAKVEGAVLIVERWILAAIRHETFFSLEQLNCRIRELLDKLNAKPMRAYGLSRRELFEKTDAAALQPLPATPYAFGTWKYARVNIDYHIEIEKHYYSVPYTLVHEQVEVRICEKTIEVFHQGKHIWTHLRSSKVHHHSTVKEHMPAEHQFMQGWSPSRLLNWAEKIGPETVVLASSILESRAHPEQGYRSVLGLLRLEKKFDAQRLEAACRRANHFGITTMRAVKNMLETRQDVLPLGEQPVSALHQHANLRGTKYYH